MVGFAGLVALSSASCSRSADNDPMKGAAAGPAGQYRPLKVAAMTVYRDPGCGCCEQWAKRAQDAGFTVAVIDNDDMPAIKRKLGVPAALGSCHTAVVGQYVLEGHVPFDSVLRLLRARPADLAGLAVPGMPRGSPGMEMPDGSSDPIEVQAFDHAGRIWAFANKSA
ncbi:DUF411 domain-containing protein [Parablastomonas sp. CN1-191]|uniref:DUF411 domain-containing protein n=1 Tax=Parablastomonas sp. CN1-191 TaxID=3400908 RepID=UPI003BF79B6A